MSIRLSAGSRAFSVVALGAALVLVPLPAAAASFTSGVLSFLSPTQSIWGPGGSAAFASSGFLLGNSVTGISYSSSASTGTVSSSVTGRWARASMKRSTSP